MVLVVSGVYPHEGHHDPGHPERPSRVGAVMLGAADLRLGEDLVTVAAYKATRPELLRVHSAAYLEELGVFCYGGGGAIDQDTYTTPDSWQIAQLAAGGGLAVIEELQRRGDGVGLVVTRPPGHHALRDRAMGFCLVNNIAVAAGALLSQGERVLILDWDVHHGNGTQAIFWDEPDVLYVSIHQWPLFPGTGYAEEVGGPRALDRTVNIPLPPGATGDVFERALAEIAAPVIAAFDPTWVLVSAGFDAHRDDLLAELQLTSGDFAQLSRFAKSCTPESGRLALFLEGGYDLNALRSSVHASLSAVLGVGEAGEAVSRGGAGIEQIERVRLARRVALDSLR